MKISVAQRTRAAIDQLEATGMPVSLRNISKISERLEGHPLAVSSICCDAEAYALYRDRRQWHPLRPRERPRLAGAWEEAVRLRMVRLFRRRRRDLVRLVLEAEALAAAYRRELETIRLRPEVPQRVTVPVSVDDELAKYFDLVAADCRYRDRFRNP